MKQSKYSKNDLFYKCGKYKEADWGKKRGIYPYFHPNESGPDPVMIMDGKPVINIGSNNYLGLTHDPRVVEAANKATIKYGTGCSGSPFLNGTLDIHIKLQEKIADFMGREAAIIFSTGFLANLGTISTIVQRGETIYCDKEDHASIIDGARMAFGDVKKFNHNDYEDLQRILEQSDNNKGKLIVVDGVYSMGGDIADLESLVKIAKKYNARTMVDEAHAIGVFGKKGRGVVEELGYEDDIDIIMGTFSKSLAAQGGFIVADYKVIDYIKHHSRALIFSASLLPSAVAAVDKAIDIIREEPERMKKVRDIGERMKIAIANLGFEVGNTQSPIVPIIVGSRYKTLEFHQTLLRYGLYANPVIEPAAPKNKCLIRTSYMATHTDEQLEQVLERLEKAGKKFGII